MPVGVATGTLLLLPLGVLAGTQLRAADRMAALSADPTAVLTNPQRVTDDGNRAVRVEFDLAVANRVIAPTWTGVITAVWVEPELVISSGDVVVTIDGINRIALASPSPLYRDLDTGMIGPDVTAVQLFLVENGYLAEATGKYDNATARAAKELRLSLGETKPPGRIDRSLFIWLPHEAWTVGSVKLETGSPAPAAGQTLMESLPTVTAARLVELDDEPVATGDDDWRIEIDDLEIYLDRNANISEPDLRLLDEPARALVAKTGGGDDSSEQDTPTITARLSLVTPGEFLTVPATALVTSGNGTACIWLANDPFSAANTNSVGVTIAGSGAAPGTANIEVLDLTGPVLANPTEMLADPSCR